jgi:hypothetical protein
MSEQALFTFSMFDEMLNGSVMRELMYFFTCVEVVGSYFNCPLVIDYQ